MFRWRFSSRTDPKLSLVGKAHARILIRHVINPMTLACAAADLIQGTALVRKVEPTQVRVSQAMLDEVLRAQLTVNGRWGVLSWHRNLSAVPPSTLRLAAEHVARLFPQIVTRADVEDMVTTLVDMTTGAVTDRAILGALEGATTDGGGPVTAAELAERMKANPATVRYRLAGLCESGLVNASGDGIHSPRWWPNAWGLVSPKPHLTDTDIVDLIAAHLAGSESWDTAAINGVAQLVSKVRPDPGTVEGNYDRAFEAATGRPIPLKLRGYSPEPWELRL
jgi:hypothetical protein